MADDDKTSSAAQASPTSPTSVARGPAEERSRRRGWARVSAVVLLTLGGVYVARLAEIGVATRRAEREEAALASDVTAVAAEVRALRTAAADAQTDASVERWAREERGWVLEGDHPIIVVASTPTPMPLQARGEPGESVIDRLRSWLGQRLR